MEYSHDENHFSNYDCDSCGSRGPTIIFYHNGTPALSQCKACAYHEHERVARRDIDAWLVGGSTSAFGRGAQNSVYSSTSR
jgi:hypothetical protein